jgi:Cof subfamily protein (haloacid dehalogenase superfamily)
MYNIDMKYRLIASDYDHTLTGPGDIVSKANYDSILKYVNLGGIFYINTGREKPSIDKALLDSPLGKLHLIVSSHQGALISVLNTDIILYKSVLKVDDTIKVMNYLKTIKGQSSFVFCEENIVCESISEFINDYTRILRISTPIIVVKSYEEYFKSSANSPMKINVSADKNVLKKIIDDVKKLFNLTFTDIGYFMAELVSPNTSKGEAHKFICNYLKININETIGLGDSQNDISLIKECGLGIAVSNACKELKKEAKLIVPNKTNEAVAKILNKVINNNM